MSSKMSQATAVAETIHSAAIKLLRLVRTEDVQAGVGPAQLSALSVLVFHGEKMLSELAAMEQVRPPTMSRIIDGLVKQDLVKRAVRADDRRSVRITPTAKGRELLLAGKARRVKALATRIEALAGEERELLRRAAEIIARL